MYMHVCMADRPTRLSLNITLFVDKKTGQTVAHWLVKSRMADAMLSTCG
jgi:hypothetical protein